MATANLNLPTTSTPTMVGGQECDLTLAIAKLNFNGNNYLGLEVKYNHYLAPGCSCEYTTELTVVNMKFTLKHYRYKNDRLFLPTFMKWNEAVDMLTTETSIDCHARVVGYRLIDNSERTYSDRTYHGTNNLRNVSCVNLTIVVGRYKLLVNKDYLVAMSGFFDEILQKADKYSRHDDLMLEEKRDDAFVTLIDICYHKFWCAPHLKDDLLDLAKLYNFPFVVEFHRRFFTLEPDSPPSDPDREFSMDATLDKELSKLLTHRFQHH